MTSRPIVILTALDLEYDAVHAHLSDPRPHTHQHGTRFEVGRLAASGTEIALALVGKGNHAAAVLAERAIAEFDPSALLFVGVAGALHSHINLGDVVVATHVYAYHGGTSEDDGAKSRPRAWETSHRADQVARHLARQVPGTIHFGPIAAGEVVLNSKVSEQARWVREHYNDALAIEMEAAGVSQAGHLSSGLPVVVIRGISDHADGTKEVTDRARWQEKAVADAADFAVRLAAELADSAGAKTAARSPRTPAEPPATTRNSASGHAFVGVQAGQIYGNIAISPEAVRPASLAEQLDDLRQEIRRARDTGALEAEDYAEAESELAVAEKSLAQSPPDRSAVRRALKRTLGLVSDVAELAARVATVIDTVRGMQ